MPVSAKNPRQLASGKWQYRYRRPDGSESSVTRATEALAIKAGEDAQEKVAAGLYVDSRAGSMPFGELWRRWLRSKRRIKDSTRQRYQSAYDSWLAVKLPGLRTPLASLAIKRFDEDVAADLIEALEHTGRATSTIHNTINPIRQALDYAVDRKWLHENPLKKLELGVKVVSVPPPPTDAELDRLIEAIGRPTKTGRSRQWAQDFCVGLVELGGRFNEVAGLRVEDVTLYRDRRARGEDVTGLVRIHRQLKDETTKRRKIVIVPVSERLYGVLERLCSEREGRELVFASSTGKAISNSNWHRDIWPQALDAAGLDPRVRPHDCRHAFGTRLANTPGVGITTVQELMGHSDIRTTRTYVHTAEDHLVDAIRKAEAHRVISAQEPAARHGATPAEGKTVQSGQFVAA